MARATSPSGTGVTDISQDGDEVDPDHDGEASDNDHPTMISLESQAKIPAAGSWGLLILATLLDLLAFRRLR